MRALQERRTKRVAGSRTADRRSSRRVGWRNDDGAVIVLVAILIAGGVISGLLAMVADLGQLYAERRVVQNGADAAALAIAQDCAEGVDGCPDQTAADARAEQFANANAPDDVTAVTEVCGPEGDGLTTCPAPGSHWTDCQPVSEEMPHYVRVRTSTLRPDGGTFLFPIFAGLLADDGDAELGTGACAQAGWGPAATVPVQFPILLPLCPGIPNNEAVVIEDFDAADPRYTDGDPCVVEGDDGGAYSDIVKGFAFGAFEDSAKNCTDPVPVSLHDVIDVQPSATQWCGASGFPGIALALQSIVDRGEPVLVPVVGQIVEENAQGQGQYSFEVIAFRSFTLLGFDIQNSRGGTAPNEGTWDGTACEDKKPTPPGQDKGDGDVPPGQDKGDGKIPPGQEDKDEGQSRSCLYGSFGPAITSGLPGDGPDTGVRAVTLIP